MDFINKQSFIVEDKELALQMLKINNVHAVEITYTEASSYPMIGRKFGHHGGQDVSIVHSKEQGLDEGFDYFTKLYVIEQEFRLEIQDLKVVKVQKAIAHKVKNNEIPI